MDNYNEQRPAFTQHDQASANLKSCLVCKKTVKGRSDKKFCNEICRNGFYNRLNAQTNNLVRNINHALGKNRRILESFFVQGEDRIITSSANQLIQKGFLFKYFTHQYTNKKGSTYYFCYDYGYLVLGNRYLLVKLSGTMS